ncbi:hypothetical protein H6F90_29385 [Trichocoleus sp. FACHB-591]|uniref:hypothetical protein n=1 Tax=Trichocoleus sp. FACHB-591 TaxID=2692872 RepID=UPI0016887CE5|nr:hypothetical protein [Trichocoleus sp. FACHB-591]MBD2099180.1 hypothetical protein [Trichocoleus sp. FACHB-591]
MSQDVVTSQMASDSLENSMPSPVWSVEDYADKLMDELFEDVDRVVEGGTSLPTETTPIENTSVQALAIPQMILASALMPRQGLTSQPVRSDAPDTALVETDSSLEKHRQFGHSFDKILLGAACASIVGIILIWLGSQGKLGRFFPTSNSSSVITTPAPTTKELADAQFGAYVQQSLETIAQLENPGKQVAAVPTTAPQSAGTLPTVPVTGNLAQPLTRIPSALERIYTLPKIPQRPYNRPVPAPVAPVVPRPVVVRPVVPMPSVAPAPVASVPIAPAAPAAPAPQVTLQGVVEWGDRSAALFEIGGSTQRINLGEGIGSSGWTLVKVSNKEAVIRRNGEVRSVYVGQQF